MASRKKRKLRKLTLAAFCALAVVALHGTTARGGEKKVPSGGIKVPPLSNGGIASLWVPAHEFIQKQYGPFELLNFSNAPDHIVRDSVVDGTWKLVAMGNFLDKRLQFATLAHLENQSTGTLLIMFEWPDRADSTAPHGVFHHELLGKEKLLIKTKQSKSGGLDTLEFSCADIQRTCGKCFYDTKSKSMRVVLTGKDE